MTFRKATKITLATLMLVAVTALAALCSPARAATKEQVAMDPGQFLRESVRCEQYFYINERKQMLPSKLLRAISVQESGRGHEALEKRFPWPWTVNVGGKGYYYNSKQEAIDAVKSFQERGYRSIDVGCMQINLRYHPDAFKDLEQAFDPKFNVAYSAELLRSHYDRHASWKRAVADYHSGGANSTDANIRGKQYARKVLSFWRDTVGATNGISSNAKTSPHISLLDVPVPVSKPDVIPSEVASLALDATYDTSAAFSSQQEHAPVYVD